MATGAVQTVQSDGLSLAYREQGSGPPVLLLHGWPTSSFLWRDVMPAIARENRVLALDLPGFGASDKPLGERYDFELFERAIDGFLASLKIDKLALAVHDLGGPVGLHWALHRPERVTKIALLNTLVYPDFSEAVLAFIKACTEPELRDQLTSPQGLEAAMRLGLAQDANLTDEVLEAVREPFASEDARRALADAGIGLPVDSFEEIARLLPSVRVPVRIVYGERDRILPDVAQTMERVKRDMPQAEVTALPDCGHFLQEEAPQQIGELLARFFVTG
jgi:pimeloyl-ACP methyl ester carboxylesterase